MNELARLQELARAEGWTPQRVCVELDALEHPISFSTASNWLRGKNIPRAASLAALRRLFDKHSTAQE